MTTHKRVKFPFEVTKGKAKDLYRLKFIRRSELEPNVRHFMKHSVGQMGKQLDVWLKEQTFTLGNLTKEQEKVLRSCHRLKVEQRRIKREGYVRYQEAVRRKLQEIRTRLLMMKVVRRFKENVAVNKQYREEEMGKRPKVDFLRIPGNEEYMYGPGWSKREQKDVEKDKNQKKHALKINATALTKFDVVDIKRGKESDNHNEYRKSDTAVDTLPDIIQDDESTVHKEKQLGSMYSHAYGGNGTHGSRNERCGAYDDAGDTSNGKYSDTDSGDSGVYGGNGGAYGGNSGSNGGYGRVGGMAVLGQTVPTAGARMETIPEEEVELEVDDLRGKHYTGLIARNLTLSLTVVPDEKRFSRICKS